MLIWYAKISTHLGTSVHTQATPEYGYYLFEDYYMRNALIYLIIICTSFIILSCSDSGKLPISEEPQGEQPQNSSVTVSLNIDQSSFSQDLKGKKLPYDGVLIQDVKLRVQHGDVTDYDNSIIEDIEQSKPVTLTLDSDNEYLFELFAYDSMYQRLCYGSLYKYISNNTTEDIELICYNESYDPVMYTGVAASGLPIDGMVTIIDSNGESKTTSIAQTGEFALDLSGMTPPYIIKAEGAVVDRYVTLYTVAYGDEFIVNVNPYSNLAAFLAAEGQDLEEIFAAPEFFLNNLSGEDMTTAYEKVKNLLKGFTDSLGILYFDPFCSHYNADGTGMDGLLDNIDLRTGSGRISIINLSTLEKILSFNFNEIDSQSIPDDVISNVANIVRQSSDIKSEVTLFTARVIRALSKGESIEDLIQQEPFFHQGYPGIYYIGDELSFPGSDIELNNVWITKYISQSEVEIGFSAEYTDINAESSDDSTTGIGSLRLKKNDGQWHITGDGQKLVVENEIITKRESNISLPDFYEYSYKLKIMIGNAIDSLLAYQNIGLLLDSENIEYIQTNMSMAEAFVVYGPALPAEGLKFKYNAENYTALPIDSQADYFDSDNSINLNSEQVAEINIAISENGIAEFSVYMYSGFDENMNPEGEPIDIYNTSIIEKIALYDAGNPADTDTFLSFVNLPSDFMEILTDGEHELETNFSDLTTYISTEKSFQVSCNQDMGTIYSNYRYFINTGDTPLYYALISSFPVQTNIWTHSVKISDTGVLTYTSQGYTPESNNYKLLDAQCRVSLKYSNYDKTIINEYLYDISENDTILSQAKEELNFDAIKMANTDISNITGDMDLITDIGDVSVTWFTMDDHLSKSTISPDGTLTKRDYENSTALVAILTHDDVITFKTIEVNLAGTQTGAFDDDYSDFKNELKSLPASAFLGSNNSFSNLTSDLNDQIDSYPDYDISYRITIDKNPDNSATENSLIQSGDYQYIASDGTFNGATCLDEDDIDIGIIITIEDPAKGFKYNRAYSGTIPLSTHTDYSDILLSQAYLDDYFGYIYSTNFDLPKEAICGTVINWQSPDPSYISDAGEIIRWTYYGKYIDMQYFISKNDDVSIDTFTQKIQHHGILNKEIASGSNFNAVYMASSGVVWGNNEFRQISSAGDNIFEPEISDMWPALPDYYRYISAGKSHILAAKHGGDLYAFGDNSKGQVGDDSFTAGDNPVQVMSDIHHFSAGGEFSVVVKEDGTLWVWGDNTHGQLGTGDNTSQTEPVQIDAGTDWVMAESGSNHVTALKKDRTVWTWGDNTYGQLGTGDNVSSNIPVQIDIEGEIDKVYAGYNHSFAETADGEIYAWGENKFGELGTSDTENKLQPVKALKSYEVKEYNDTGAVTKVCYHNFYSISDLALGRYHTLIFGNRSSSLPNHCLENGYVTESFTDDSRNIIYGIGDNSHGQLGEYTGDSSIVPVIIYQNNDSYEYYTSAAGEYSSVSADYTDSTDTANGDDYTKKVITIGDNSYYQLGRGDNNNAGSSVHEFIINIYKSDDNTVRTINIEE